MELKIHPDADTLEPGKCPAQTKKGNLCGQTAWYGSDRFCMFHDPSDAALEARTSGRREGTAALRKERAPLPPAPPPPESAGDVKEVMKYAYAALLQDRMTEKKFNELRKGMDTLLKALDAEKKEAKMEAKIQDLRAKLRKLQGDRGE